MVNVDDSIGGVSSSYMMSSAGKDQITAGGKTHIKVGSMSGGKGSDTKNVAASSNLDETEEDDSESMSVSMSQSESQNNKMSTQWNALREKYLAGGLAKGSVSDDDSDDSDDDDDEFDDSDDKL